MMRKNLLSAALLLSSLSLYAQGTPEPDAEGDPADLMSDTWVATDALGRTMPGVDSVGVVRHDQRRVVGIFYVTWHTPENHNTQGPYANVTEILQDDPMARMQNDPKAWRFGMYHWGEPEAGYFLSQDEWVIRRDLSMLQDAGVDVLILDATNGICYWDQWDLLFATMAKMRQEGNRTPQFAFWSYNGNPVEVVRQIYQRYYKAGLYRDLWFLWDGRPLLLYNADPSSDATGEHPDRHASDYQQGPSPCPERVGEPVFLGRVDGLQDEGEGQVDYTYDYGNDHVGVESGDVPGDHALLQPFRNPSGGGDVVAEEGVHHYSDHEGGGSKGTDKWCDVFHSLGTTQQEAEYDEDQSVASVSHAHREEKQEEDGKVGGRVELVVFRPSIHVSQD